MHWLRRPTRAFSRRLPAHEGSAVIEAGIRAGLIAMAALIELDRAVYAAAAG